MMPISPQFSDDATCSPALYHVQMGSPGLCLGQTEGPELCPDWMKVSSFMSRVDG